MEFRKASLSDLKAVTGIFQAAVHHMDGQGIPQWDELYPAEEDLKGDIERSEMTLGLENGVPVCTYTLNRDCDPEYATGTWRYTGPDFRVLHRLCVAPSCQNRGIARQAMNYFEEALRGEDCRALRLDVFSGNPYALSLYENRGFRRVGEARWRKGLFYLYEKIL